MNYNPPLLRSSLSILVRCRSSPGSRGDSYWYWPLSQILSLTSAQVRFSTLRLGRNRAMLPLCRVELNQMYQHIS